MFLRRIPVAAALALIAAGLYFAGMVLVYLGTSADPEWLVSVSGLRTMMIVNLMLLAGVYAVLDGILDRLEANDRAPGVAAPASDAS